MIIHNMCYGKLVKHFILVHLIVLCVLKFSFKFLDSKNVFSG